MNPFSLCLLLFLSFLVCQVVLLAKIEHNCTSFLEANSDPANTKTGLVSKGITFKWQEYPMDGTVSICNSNFCFGELKTKKYDPNEKKGTSITWQNYLCLLLGKGFNGTVQVNMEYHCYDEPNGKEITTTQVAVKPDGTKLTHLHC